MTSPSNSSRSALFLLVALGLTACAGSSPVLREAAAQHVYSQPLEQLWPGVGAFMTEQGYTWRTAPGQYVLRTEWRENGTRGANRTLVSYLVQGEPHPSGGCVLRVSRGLKADPNDQALDTSNPPIPGANSTMATWDRLAQNETALQSQRAIYAPARDVDMELALMRALDPAAVTKLEGKDASASAQATP
ncbi:hypothetical protein [Hyalangium gracile]|uniref:hypothetical protein n=1 Tax=Hyalangium gracile TaxID=394092 RepID=UPI001CCCB732|nr:hypothetical protein [Hyalangium gracile]